MISTRQRQLALLVAGCFFLENLDGTIVTTANATPFISKEADKRAARKARQAPGKVAPYLLPSCGVLRNSCVSQTPPTLRSLLPTRTKLMSLRRALVNLLHTGLHRRLVRCEILRRFHSILTAVSHRGEVANKDQTQVSQAPWASGIPICDCRVVHDRR